MYKRIVAIVFGIFVTLAGLAFAILSSMIEQHRTFADQVRRWTMERTSITQIEEIDEYRGTSSYAVVIGKNSAGTPVIAWMTEDKLVFDTLERAVPEQSVREAAERGFPGADIQRIVPGLEGDQRFWEVTLVDSQGRYHFIHYDFYNGNVIKSFRVTPEGL